MSRAAIATLALCSALAACSTAPRGPSAEVQASCPALEAMPARTDVAALYRACREAALQTEPQPMPGMPRLCPQAPGTSVGANPGAFGPWQQDCTR